jgi:hypothetical protein
MARTISKQGKNESKEHYRDLLINGTTAWNKIRKPKTINKKSAQ